MINVRQWLRNIECEHPGFAERLWNQYGRDATAAGDERVAEYLRIFSTARGEPMAIEGRQWGDYRVEMGLVSYHRRGRIVNPSSNGHAVTDALEHSADERVAQAYTETTWTHGVGYPDDFLALLDTLYGCHEFISERLEPVLIAHIQKHHARTWTSLRGVLNTYHDLWRDVQTWQIIALRGDKSGWDLCEDFYQLYVRDMAAYGDRYPSSAHFVRWAVWHDISVVMQELFGTLLDIALENLPDNLFVADDVPVQATTGAEESLP